MKIFSKFSVVQTLFLFKKGFVSVKHPELWVRHENAQMSTCCSHPGSGL